MMEHALEPQGSFLLVRRHAPSRELGSGLVAPDTARQADAVRATIVRRGPDCHGAYQEDTDIIVGPYAGTIIAQEGGSPDELILLPQSEVMAIVEASDAAA